MLNLVKVIDIPKCSVSSFFSDVMEAVHFGTNPGHFETLRIHFPMSEGVSEVSERANE